MGPSCPKCGLLAGQYCNRSDCVLLQSLVLEPEQQTDYIPRIRDAELRLDCFRVVVQSVGEKLDFDVALRCAESLYRWTMELTEDESDTEEVLATSEESSKCDVKH